MQSDAARPAKSDPEDSDLHVVVIDDSENDFVIMRTLLARSSSVFIVEWVRSYSDGLRRVSDDAAAVYVVDYDLPGENSGLELIKNARLGGCAKPLLLVTNSEDPGLGTAAVLAGATDFLDKKDGDEADALAQLIWRAVGRRLLLPRG